MDKFPSIHAWVDTLPRFSDIAYAIKDLNSYDYLINDERKIGHLSRGERGFDNIARIIEANRPEIQGDFVAVAQWNGMTVADIEITNVIYIVPESSREYLAVTTEPIFREWIAKDRERIFLKAGLSCIALGFFFGIVGRFERRKP